VNGREVKHEEVKAPDTILASCKIEETPKETFSMAEEPFQFNIIVIFNRLCTTLVTLNKFANNFLFSQL